MALRVLGVDPGSRRVGYGVVERDGSRLRHVDNGVLVLPSRAPLVPRLRDIFHGLKRVIEEHHPEVSAFEEVFVHRNVRSALTLGHARGVAQLAAVEAGMEVFEYSPSEVKQAVTGSGRAEKEQVQRMVKMILGLPEVAQEDASDALAVAICHCNHRLDAMGRRR